MATVADAIAPEMTVRPAGSTLGRAIDRWIFVFMAVWFIAIVLAGFIPSSLTKIEAVRIGARPPFPIIMHVHALLMGAFLLLLLAQTTLAAIGRCDLHRRLGPAAILLAPALVIAGFILVPTLYHSVWNAAQAAPAEAAEQMRAAIRGRDNILLIQMRIGLLFTLFLAIGLMARRRDSGLHKRMMILGTAVTLSAAFARIPWLPSTLPANPLSGELYILLAVSPLFLWDVARNRTIHRAWLIWIGICLPVTLVVHGLWDTEWWHSVVPRIMGV